MIQIFLLTKMFMTQHLPRPDSCR